MASLNKVQIIGRLGRDPEVKAMQDGRKIVNLSIATSERWKDKQTGEQKEATEWHRVVIFNDKIAQVAERFLNKGDSVYIEGQLQTRKWQDQSGQEKYSTEIVLKVYQGELKMLGGKSGDQDDGARDYRAPLGADTPKSRPPAPTLDDEIPF